MRGRCTDIRSTSLSTLIDRLLRWMTFDCSKTFEISKKGLDDDLEEMYMMG